MKTNLHTPYVSQLAVVATPRPSSIGEGSRSNENLPDATSSTPSRPRRGIGTKKWLSAFCKCARPQTAEETRPNATEECPPQNESLQQAINMELSAKHDNVVRATAHYKSPTAGLNTFLKKYGAVTQEPHKVAIDLGAGGGRDTRALAANGWRITAVDTSPETVKALSDTDSNQVEVFQGTLQQAKVSDGAIGLVNAQRVLPYLVAEDLRDTLRETARILRPGGHLCASFFGPNHTWNDGEHEPTFHSQKDIQQLLSEAGLTIIEMHSWNKPLKSAKGKLVPNWHEINVIAEKKKPQQSRAESSRAAESSRVRQNRIKFLTEEAERRGLLFR